jgi:quinol monooxygenase YgiN
MTIIVRAEVHVLREDLDAFREVADQLAAASKDEPGTIQYRWFSGGDPSTFVVIEEYADENAAFSHNHNCAQLLDRSGRLSMMTSVQVHGDLGPDLLRWIEQHPQAHGYPALR